MYSKALCSSSAVAREQGQELASTEAIDDCGLRYLLAARHHVYLMNTLPLRQRAQLQRQGLSPAYFVWAFHSEAEEVSSTLLAASADSPE